MGHAVRAAVTADAMRKHQDPDAQHGDLRRYTSVLAATLSAGAPVSERERRQLRVT